MLKPNGAFPPELKEYAEMVERGNKNFALWAAKQPRHGPTLEERAKPTRGLRGFLSRFWRLLNPKERG